MIQNFFSSLAFRQLADLIHLLLSRLLLHVHRLHRLAICGLTSLGISLLRIAALLWVTLLTRLLHIHGLALNGHLSHNHSVDHDLFDRCRLRHRTIRNLKIHLSRHAAGDRAVSHVRDTSNQLCQLSELGKENGQDVADACQNLQTIVASNHATIAWVALQAFVVHHIQTSRADGETREAQYFTNQTALWAAMFAALTSFEAAHVGIPLTACVFGHVVVQHFATQLKLSAWSAKACNCTTCRVCTCSINQGSLESIALCMEIAFNWSAVTKAAHSS